MIGNRVHYVIYVKLTAFLCRRGEIETETRVLQKQSIKSTVGVKFKDFTN